MLDIKIIRESPELVRKSLEKRQDFEKLKMLEDLIVKDKQWKRLKAKIDGLRYERNKLSEEINSLKQQGKDVSEKISAAKLIPEQIREVEASMREIREQVDYYLMRLPNILHESVPFGKSEEENQVVKAIGKPLIPKFPVKHHGELAVSLNGADFERAVKISGTGFYSLKGSLAALNLALVNYAVDVMVEQGFQLVIPPFLMRRKPYEGVVDLEDFENVMYKVQDVDEYLIATAEHPLIAMFSDEILKEEQLPIKLCGYSMNFRREVGKHGLDERGLFRLHQFDKVEQAVICKPEQSWKILEELLSNAEKIVKGLELPYRVTTACTGDIGIVAAKKLDIECWSPREQKYFETHSLSNCTSYQAIRSNIKYRKFKIDEKEYCHTLNATALAIPRILRAILENHQTSQGAIKIPRALQKYMGGLKEVAPLTERQEKAKLIVKAKIKKHKKPLKKKKIKARKQK